MKLDEVKIGGLEAEAPKLKIEVLMPQLEDLKDMIWRMSNAQDDTRNMVDALMRNAGFPMPGGSLYMDEKASGLTRAELDEQTERHRADIEARSKPRKRRTTAPADAKPPEPEPVKPNGEDQDDEDTLRARAGFEAKRVQRTLGVGGLRAAICKVAGADVLQIDDVPVAKLAQLLTELQAL
jgi:hypothetical protein